MIAGHFGFAALVKSRERSTPLWMLMLASVWLDVVFVPLFLAGIETLQPMQGRSGYGAAVIHADYTHSIVGMLALSLLLALVCWSRWGSRSATVVGLVAVSHWALDLIVHHADMAVLPGNLGNLPRLGFGLWDYPMLAAALEALLVLLGAGFYRRAAREVSIRANRRPQWATAVSVLIATCGLFVLYLDVSSR